MNAHCRTHSRPHHAFPFGQFDQMASWFSTWMPYDLTETEAEYEVVMPLPGFQVEDIEVSVKDHEILIEAHPKRDPSDATTEPDEPKSSEDGSETIEHQKFFSMIWDREIAVSIPVQHEVDPQQVRAKLNRGLLKIRFIKQPESKIKINIDE